MELEVVEAYASLKMEVAGQEKRLEVQRLEIDKFVKYIAELEAKPTLEEFVHLAYGDKDVWLVADKSAELVDYMRSLKELPPLEQVVTEESQWKS